MVNRFNFLLSLLLVTGCTTVSRDTIPCVIPDLPMWNELVLRLWGSSQISRETFLKNFQISGESGDRHLRRQGYDPADLAPLASCLVEHFYAHPD